MSSRVYWVLRGEPSRGPDSHNLRQEVDGVVVRNLDWDTAVPVEVMEALCHLIASANVDAMRRHELETVAAEAYQAVASMANDLGVMGDGRVYKLLENLKRVKLVHQDVLPWPSFERVEPSGPGAVEKVLDQLAHGSHLDETSLNHDIDSLQQIADSMSTNAWQRGALHRHAARVEKVLASVNERKPVEPHIVKLHAWGGQARHHDYLMSDGTVRTMKDTEARALRQQHSDENVVDRFAEAMKEKLAAARRKGRQGWETATGATLSSMLRDHVEKGDPLDVANFCMFLWSLEQPIEPKNHVDEDGTTWTVPTAEAYAKVCKASRRQREALGKIKDLVEAGQGTSWNTPSATIKSRTEIHELCTGALRPSRGEKR